MARYYNYAIKCSTPEITAIAFKEYTATVVENQQKLINLIATVTDDAYSEAPQLKVDDISAIIEEEGFNENCSYFLNSGTVLLKDLLSRLHSSMVADGLSIDVGKLGDMEKIFSIPTLEGYDLKISHENLMQEMNATLHAIVTDNAIATAFAAGGSIAEKVSLVRDTVMTFFRDGFTDTSGSLIQAIDMMKSSSSLADYVNLKLSFSGINSAAANGDLIINSKEFEYTGASPASAYCFDTVKNVITSSLKVAAAATVAVFRGILSVGKTLFKKAAKVIKEIAVDPYDLRKINGEDGNHTINGFVCQVSPQVHELRPDRYDLLISKLEKGPLHCDFLSAEVMLYLDQDKYIKFPKTTITDQAVVLAKLNGASDTQISEASTLMDLYSLALSDEIDDKILTHLRARVMSLGTPTESAANNLFDLNEQLYYLLLWENQAVQGQLKIKPLSYKMYASYVPVANSLSAYSIPDMVNFVNHLTSTPCVYADVDDDETDLYNSFILGMYATTIIFAVMRMEADGTLEEYPNGEISVLDVGVPYFSYQLDPNVKITNADFLQMAVAGWFNEELQVFHVDEAMKVAMANLQLSLCNVFAYREEHPLDYSFWPYCQNMVDWFPNSFEIVPDSDNIDRFNVAVTAFVVITAVVTVALVTGIKLKRAYHKSVVTKHAALVKAAQAFNNGTLDKQALRTFRRASFKNAILSKLTGNLVIADSRSNSNENNTVDFSPLFAIISGDTIV